MGIIMLICLITLGFGAFSVGIPLCGAIGVVYGVKSKDKNLVRWSSVALLLGISLFIYTFLLVSSM